MDSKAIISSSHTDLHGDNLKEIHEDLVKNLNGVRKMRMLLNHRRDLPPIGFWKDAEIYKEGNHQFVSATKTFFGNREEVQWDINLIKERANNPVVLIDRNDIVETLVVSIDKNNLSHFNDFKNYSSEICKLSNETVAFEMHSRKNALLQPEIIIKIATCTVIYPILHPVLKRIGERLANDIGDNIYDVSKQKIIEFQKYIFKVFKITKSKIVPNDQDLVTIFEIPGPYYIELFAKTSSAELVSKALSERKLQLVKLEIEQLSKQVDIKEIYFNLNKSGKWKFSYLITVKGEIIGTKALFKQRDKLYKKILLSPTAGHSLSGRNVKFEKE